MQHRMLDAADVLVHRHPVIIARIDHRVIAARRAVAHEVPRRINEGIHGVGFAPCRFAAGGAIDVQKLLMLVQWIAAAVGYAIFWQHHRQIFFWHRHIAAMVAVNDWNRRAPITLARNAPVAQAVGNFLFTDIQVGQYLGDRIGRFGIVHAIEATRVDAAAIFFIGIPVMPCLSRKYFAFHIDDRLDRQHIFLCKREVAFVMRRHAHHRAVAVRDQYIVADPDFDLLAGDWMRDQQTGRHAFLFHRRHVGFDDAAEFAFGDEGGEFGIGFGGEGSQRMFRCDSAKGHALDRVGASREDPQFAVVDQFVAIMNRVLEREAHAGRFADPVGLHRPYSLGPAGQFIVDMVEQFFGVVGDAGVVHRDFALFDQRARSPAAAVDDLLVGEYCFIDRVPIYGAGFFVDDALLKHLQKHPLIPLVVLGLASGHLARPVDCQSHRLHLLLHVLDIGIRPLRRWHVVGHRRVFGRHAERIPAHRHQHVVTVHAQVAHHHIVDRVITHMAHVQLAGRVGQHRASVEFFLWIAVRVGRVFGDFVGIDGAPVGLRIFFDVGGMVGWLHFG